MGGSKSPGAGGQTAVAQEVEKLLRKNPEMFEEMLDKKPKKFSLGGRAGDVRDNSNRGKTF
jgi:hypothetical protein